MIASASRRTDIPAHDMPWMMERLREGFAIARNPMNPKQERRVDLSPDAVDALVFWTKQPGGLLPYLGELSRHRYYVQCTINDYGADVEPGMPPLAARLDDALRLSEAIGPERVIWRYDPILINQKYTAGAHAEYFTAMAKALSGAVRHVTISFLDDYPRVHRRLMALGVIFPGEETQLALAGQLAAMARAFGMTMSACCEPVDFSKAGVARAHCVDAALIERLWGVRIGGKTDSGQRPGCGCAPSVDIGTYGSCVSGCVYCYARGKSVAPNSGIRSESTP